jgi:purine-binding chemotaxis protein CheW
MSETVLDRRQDLAPPRGAGRSGSAGTAHADGAGRYLTFTLGSEIYALEILEISEIIEFRALTVVPMMPSFIRGVINLRGRVLPVVDLAARFGQPATAVGRRTSIIVVETPDQLTGPKSTDEPDTTGALHGIGIMVDAVNKVVHLGADDIEPPPAFGVGIRTDFISGMAKHDDGFIVMLDIEMVLSVHHMALLGHTSTTTAPTPDSPADEVRQ